jgi:hypothetical protein
MELLVREIQEDFGLLVYLSIIQVVVAVLVLLVNLDPTQRVEMVVMD